MAIVSSFGTLQRYAGVSGVPSVDTGRHTSLDTLSLHTYAAIYRTQPNVRTVVDFLARNIAQLGLHAFRRVSDLDRQRLADHDVIQWLEHPNPGTTRYKLFETLMQDLGIYFLAYWLKVRRPDGGLGLVRVPPEQVTVNGWLLPSSFTWTLPDGRDLELAPNQVVYLHGFDPCDPLSAISPLETLRQILAEDAAATAYRRAYWSNSSRIEGVITRPKDAPKWTPDQKQAFREQWQLRFAGTQNAGQTAVLEDGMDYKPMSFSARDSELTAGRKLTREEVARAYHVPQPMVGILDHATYSNVKEQHKHLYQDTLGPWCEWIQQEIERQLLPESDDPDDVYFEFNIADKLKGSFEEQGDAIFKLTGRPVMTANEGRARLNLPRITDDPTADQLAMPLNTSTGAADQAALDAATPTVPATDGTVVTDDDLEQVA